jgi:ABC-type Fe3+/spermidine/putrescine transport system ATPase subunit
MEGRVADLRDGAITLRLRNNALLEAHLDTKETKTETSEGSVTHKRKPKKKAFERNMLVVAVIRPEFISLNKKESARIRRATNTFKAIVNNAVFMGGTIRYELTLENEDHITSRLPADQFKESLRTGEEIAATIDPDAILLYPYPRIGLAKEISLE